MDKKENIYAPPVYAIVAPIASPEAGAKKLLAGTLPLVPLLPWTRVTSTLLKLASVHLVLPSHELPLDVAPLRLTWSAWAVLPPLLSAATFLENLPVTPVAPVSWNPTPPFLYAVLRVKVNSPGCLLSVKPLAELPKAMLLVTTWLALVVLPPPSLYPLPSPSKGVKSHLLKPLPHEMVSSMLMGDANSLWCLWLASPFVLT